MYAVAVLGYCGGQNSFKSGRGPTQVKRGIYWNYRAILELEGNSCYSTFIQQICTDTDINIDANVDLSILPVKSGIFCLLGSSILDVQW